jgi:hypothetical protein
MTNVKIDERLRIYYVYKMTEYTILEESFTNDIFAYMKPAPASKMVNEIKKMISNGWQPCGDICLSNFSYNDGSGTTWIAQPMLKKPGNIIDYILISLGVGKNIEVENYLLKGYELFGNIKSVGRGIYYQVVVKRIHLIPDIL